MARLGIGALSLTHNRHPSHRSPVREYSNNILHHSLDSRAVCNGSDGYSVNDHEGRCCDLPLCRKDHRYGCVQGHRRTTNSSRSTPLRAQLLKGTRRLTIGSCQPSMTSWSVPCAAQVSMSTKLNGTIARVTTEPTRPGRGDLSPLVFRAPGGTGR